MTMNGSGVDALIADFVERMGLIFQADGLPRIAGRLLGFLVVHGDAFRFGDLADHLQVSRASISTNTRLLEDLGVIERMARAGERQDYFQLRPDAYGQLMKGLLGRMRNARALIGRTGAQLPETHAGSQVRLHELGDFYDTMITGMETMIARWNSRPPATDDLASGARDAEGLTQ